MVTLKGQGAPDHISRTPGQEVAQIEAELRTLGVRKGHKCPFCRLPVPDKLRWKTQGGGKDCPLMYRTARTPKFQGALGRRPWARRLRTSTRGPHPRGNQSVNTRRVDGAGRRLRFDCVRRPRPRPVADNLVNAYQGVAREVQDEAEIVWSAPADAEDDEEPAARKKRCACVKDDGQRCREVVLGADDWDASMGDWDPERYCSQDCARAEERRAARILAERAPAPAPSDEAEAAAPAVARRRPRGHDRGLREAPEEAAAEETSSSEDEDEDEDESSVDDDEAPAAPAPGRVVGTVRKWDGRRGFIRLEGQASDAVLFEDNVRGGATLRVGDRVEFALRPGKKHPSAVDVAPLAAAPAPTAAPAAGRVVGVVRKFDGASGWITLTGGKTGGKHRVEAIAARNVRPGEALAAGDEVDFVAEEPPRNVRNGSLTARDVARRRAPAPRPAPAAAAAPSSGDAFVDALHAWIVGRKARQASRAAPWASSGRRTPRCRGRSSGRAHRGARRRFAPLRRGPGGHNHIEIVGEGSASAPAPAPRAPPGSRARPARSRGGRGRAAPATASSSARRARRTSSSTRAASGRASRACGRATA